jgi:ABC-type sugar transport system permease subunit/ABC-type glycerol-3-phosphate transport system permease component
MSRHLERISRVLSWSTLGTLIVLGASILIALLYSVGDPRPEFAELDADRSRLLSYVSNTAILFGLSLLIQTPFFMLGTMYIRKLNIFARVVLLLPFATGTIAPAAGFYTLLSSQIGPLDWSLATDAIGARLLIAIIDAWQWTGVLLFMCFAYTERIPTSQFEQASVERISRFQQWRLATWPVLSRVVGIYILIKALDWVRKFEIINVLFGSGGGPGEILKTFTMHAYARAFDSGMEGYSSLLALIEVMVLAICVTLIFRLSKMPRMIGRPIYADMRGPGTPGRIIFWLLLGAFQLAPVAWLLSMSFQPSGMIFHGGFHLFPQAATWENYLEFMPWSNAPYFRDFLISVAFYGLVALVAIVLALNETYQLIVYPSEKREIRRVLTVVGIFFLPAFAAFDALEQLDRLLPQISDLLALLIVQVVNGYALAFVVVYAVFKYGFEHRYEQVLLEYRRALPALWHEIVLPQIWVVGIAAVLVFAATWNELFLNDKWTSGIETRPFAVLIGTAVQQYSLQYNVLAAGAVISMITPLALMGMVLVLIRLVWIARKLFGQKISYKEVADHRAASTGAV